MELDLTQKELNRELKRIHEEMTSPERQDEAQLKARIEKEINRSRERVGL